MKGRVHGIVSITDAEDGWIGREAGDDRVHDCVLPSIFPSTVAGTARGSQAPIRKVGTASKQVGEEGVTKDPADEVDEVMFHVAIAGSRRGGVLNEAAGTFPSERQSPVTLLDTHTDHDGMYG